MDIKDTLAELQALMAAGDMQKVCVRCTEILATGLADAPSILVLENYVRALHVLGRLNEAEAACTREVILLENMFGADHPHVSSALHNLSRIIGEQGRHEEAIPVSERELAIVRASNPGSGREADALVTLAEHHYENSRFEKADELLKEALAIYEKVEGGRFMGVSTCLNNLGRSAENQGKESEALLYLAEAADIRLQVLGNHPDTAFTLLNYGTALASVGEFTEASRVLMKGAEIYSQLGMDSSPYAKACRDNLQVCQQNIQPIVCSCAAGGAGGCCG